MSRLPSGFWPTRMIFLGQGLAVAALLSISVCTLGRLIIDSSVSSWAVPAQQPTESGEVSAQTVGTAHRGSYRRIYAGQTSPGQTFTGNGRSERRFVRLASVAIAASDAQTAANHYQQAMDLANQAVVAYQSALREHKAGNLAKSLSFTRQERSHWQESLQKLAAIPQSSTLYDQAIAKHTQYQALLITAEGKLLNAQDGSTEDGSTEDGSAEDGSTADDFLLNAIQEASVSPQQVHITLCQIETLALEPPESETLALAKTSGQTASNRADASPDNQPADNGPADLLYNGYLTPERCHHHLGAQPMASPASLIKVPIAMVLMHKVTTEGIDLDKGIFIDPGNFTENAEGAKIDVGETYPLRAVMTRMINESNNIATNQLIDYLGRDYLADILTEKGYIKTWAGHKLAGDWIMPEDAGTRINQSTTNELTAMLARIYSLKTPGDEELLSALVSQSDRELGYAALKNMAPSVHWIGEKTGQNDQVIATSLAMKIGEERYALTVAIDHSADLYAVQTIIQSIANHLLKTGPLVEPTQK